jgi:hypothetical protein
VSALQSIRLVKANPSLRVAGERRPVFAAALEQAEQLMNAAATAGAALLMRVTRLAVPQGPRGAYWGFGGVRISCVPTPGGGFSGIGLGGPGLGEGGSSGIRR